MSCILEYAQKTINFSSLWWLPSLSSCSKIKIHMSQLFLEQMSLLIQKRWILVMWIFIFLPIIIKLEIYINEDQGLYWLQPKWTFHLIIHNHNYYNFRNNIYFNHSPCRFLRSFFINQLTNFIFNFETLFNVIVSHAFMKFNIHSLLLLVAHGTYFLDPRD